MKLRIAKQFRFAPVARSSSSSEDVLYWTWLLSVGRYVPDRTPSTAHGMEDPNPQDREDSNKMPSATSRMSKMVTFCSLCTAMGEKRARESAILSAMLFPAGQEPSKPHAPPASLPATAKTRQRWQVYFYGAFGDRDMFFLWAQPSSPCDELVAHTAGTSQDTRFNLSKHGPRLSHVSFENRPSKSIFFNWTGPLYFARVWPFHTPRAQLASGWVHACCMRYHTSTVWAAERKICQARAFVSLALTTVLT